MADTPIPETIQEYMHDEELENMRNLDGWAVGTVVQIIDGAVTKRIEDAWIELFNGEGRAGEFEGVRFLAVHEDEYEESYAYSSAAAMGEKKTAWCVEEWKEPEEPDIGLTKA